MRTLDDTASTTESDTETEAPRRGSNEVSYGLSLVTSRTEPLPSRLVTPQPSHQGLRSAATGQREGTDDANDDDDDEGGGDKS